MADELGVGVHILGNLDDFNMEKKEDGTIVLTQKRKLEENETPDNSQNEGLYKWLLLAKFLKEEWNFFGLQ